MSKKRTKIEIPEIEITAYDELFTTQEMRDDVNKEKVTSVEIDLIDTFKNHPFKVRMDNAMLEMVDSIKNYGVLVPALIRPKKDGRYEMVAGHRRGEAIRLAGELKIPCIIREMSDEEATIIMVDSNLQREEILPSERAFAYKMKMEATKKQGKRTDLTSPPLVEKLNEKETLTASKVGKEAGDSHEQVRRYIRLTELVAEILEMVDDQRMGFRAAVEVSYISHEHQYSLLEAMGYYDAAPTHAQACKLKKFYQTGELNDAVIKSIMAEEKFNLKREVQFKNERITGLIPKSEKGREMDYVVKALEHYNRYLERNKERGR